MRLLRRAAIGCLFAVASCEQELVVIDRGDGGAGTAASTVEGVSSVATTGGGGGCADVQQPVGQPFDCTPGSATVGPGGYGGGGGSGGSGGAGGSGECGACVGDSAGNEYRAYCVGGLCTCYLNAKEVCSCRHEPSSCPTVCCPDPWNHSFRQ